MHFAVDDAEVRFCTHLKGKASWFLPFNEGWNDGAGNPPNPDGLKTDYLWKRILTPRGLTDILENYAQIVAPALHQLSIICPGEISSKGRGSARILADLRSRPHHGALRASDRMAHKICSLFGLERRSSYRDWHDLLVAPERGANLETARERRIARLIAISLGSMPSV